MKESLDKIEKFLSEPRTIAVLGASNKDHRAGHYVPKFLQSKGWEIIPVNPHEVEILGEKSLDDISEIDQEIDGILIYRNNKDAKKEALRVIHNEVAPLIWFPDNITSNTVATKANEKNITFIQDRCPLRDYRYLFE